MSAARVWGRLAAVAVAGTSEVLAHRLGSPAARTAARYGAAAALLGIARWAGVSWAGLGLGRSEVGSGLRTGVVAGAAAAAAVFAGAAVPGTRRLFLDQRAADADGRGGLATGLARITFATVPPEELIYRSALLGLWLAEGPQAGTGEGSQSGAVVWSSVLFGVSHILPTLSTMGHSALNQHLVDRPLRQAAFVAGNVAATSAAGAVFGRLRLRSGSVLAPLLAHVAVNDSALMAGRAAHRLIPGREQTQGPLAVFTT